MIDEIIDLLERLPKGLSGSERESLRAQLLRLMNAQSSNSNLYAPAEVGTDSDKLDGQHGSYYQDASNINAGTLSTDRYSAYTDLGAESKIGAGAAQVAAGDHAHAGVIVNPMTTAGDMIYQPGSLTVNNSDPTGNKIINESPSSTEKIIPICDLTIPDPVGNITINWDVWVSMNQLGTQKKVTVNLRRDSVTGAVLWTQEQIMATDSVLGHDRQYTSSFVDTNVTTGRYVLTTDATGASTVAIYGDTRTFSISGTTNTPYRLPIGPAGYILTVNAGGTSPEWTTPAGADTTAIHDNVSNEIHSVAQKLVGFASDEVLLEDSEASFVKKRFSLANLNTYIRNNLDSVYAAISKGVTNGDTHDHSGGDGAQINHTTLSNIGTNTHAQVDTFIASKAAASGLASLDASSLVIQNPANATATPTANKIIIANANGKADNGWIGIPWAAFTCTLTGSTGSAGTYAEDLAYARYTIIGNLCHMVVRKRVTNLGSWTGDVRLSYPVNRAGSHGGVLGSGSVFANGAAITAPKANIAILSGAYCQFYKTILGYLQWADLAINDYILINVTYEV